jgi:plasmid stabilization system protein ParE
MIPRQIAFHPAAIEQGVEAARWYRLRSRRAAQRFVREITQALDRIADAPERWPAGPQGTRKVRIPCFPFLIVYRDTWDAVQILAIAHARRRPDYWKQRL